MQFSSMHDFENVLFCEVFDLTVTFIVTAKRQFKWENTFQTICIDQCNCTLIVHQRFILKNCRLTSDKVSVFIYTQTGYSINPYFKDLTTEVKLSAWSTPISLYIAQSECACSLVKYITSWCPQTKSYSVYNTQQPYSDIWVHIYGNGNT